MKYRLNSDGYLGKKAGYVFTYDWYVKQFDTEQDAKSQLESRLRTDFFSEVKSAPKADTSEEPKADKPKPAAKKPAAKRTTKKEA
jgi:hypothetical protein